MAIQKTLRTTDRFAPKDGTAAWILLRTTADGQRERCMLHDPGKGMRLAEFPVDWLAPSVQVVGSIWGSGTYRFNWQSADRKSIGGSPEFSIDDPKLPTQPAYPNPPKVTAAPAATAPVEPASDPASRMLQEMAALNGGGSIPLPLVMVLFDLMRQSDAQAERKAAERRRADELEHEQRLARIRAESDIAIERERARALQQVEETKQFHASLAQQVRPAADPALAAILEELKAAREEREDAVGGGEDSPVNQLVKSLMPMVGPLASAAMQKLGSNGAAALPAGVRS